jgi:hypothetical protein
MERGTSRSLFESSGVVRYAAELAEIYTTKMTMDEIEKDVTAAGQKII